MVETVDYPGSLAKLLAEHKSTIPSSSEFYRLLEQWAKEDFQAAEQWVIKTGFERNLSYGYKCLCTGLIANKPDEARIWASSIKDSDGRRIAWIEIYQQLWSKKSLEERLDLVLEIADPSVRQKLLWRVFRSWAQHDYEAAMEVASKLEDAGDQEAAMQMLPENHPNRIEVKEALAEAKKRSDDFDSVTNWLTTIQDFVAKNEAEMLVARLWLQKAPAKVAEWAPQTGNQNLLHMVYAAWAKEDKDAAINAAKQIADIEIKSQAIVGIIGSGILAPERAVELISLIGDPVAKEEAVQTLSGDWGRTQPAEAMAWIRTFESPGLKNAAQIKIIRSQLPKNPKRAGELALSIDDPETRSTAAWIVAGNWAKKKPHEAMAWAKGINDAEAKSRAQLRIAKYATLYWGPKSGAELAKSIEDKDTRIEALKVVYGKWQNDGHHKIGDAWLKAFVDEGVQAQIKASDGFSQAMERFDENGDGVVDQAEIRKAAMAILERIENKGLQGTWVDFDKNKNGALDAGERQTLLKDLIERLNQGH